jgi:hypothetical protein
MLSLWITLYIQGSGNHRKKNNNEPNNVRIGAHNKSIPGLFVLRM